MYILDKNSKLQSIVDCQETRDTFRLFNQKIKNGYKLYSVCTDNDLQYKLDIELDEKYVKVYSIIVRNVKNNSTLFSAKVLYTDNSMVMKINHNPNLEDRVEKFFVRCFTETTTCKIYTLDD